MAANPLYIRSSATVVHIDLNRDRVLTQTPLLRQVESIDIIGLKAPASSSGSLLVKELKVLG